MESAAVLWGVALRPSRPSSALAVRVERRLAHRRVAGPRKLGTRRPDGRADPDTKQHRRGGRAPRRQRRARRREAERKSARPKRRRAAAVPGTASRRKRGGRPRGARSARRLPSSQSLVIRRRPVLSVIVVASRPFDMVPDGLRSLRGQLSGAAGCFTAGAGLDGLLSADAEAVPLATFTPRRSYFVFCSSVDGVPAGAVQSHRDEWRAEFSANSRPSTLRVPPQPPLSMQFQVRIAGPDMGRRVWPGGMGAMDQAGDNAIDAARR